MIEVAIVLDFLGPLKNLNPVLPCLTTGSVPEGCLSFISLHLAIFSCCIPFSSSLDPSLMIIPRVCFAIPLKNSRHSRLVASFIPSMTKHPVRHRALQSRQGANGVLPDNLTSDAAERKKDEDWRNFQEFCRGFDTSQWHGFNDDQLNDQTQWRQTLEHFHPNIRWEGDVPYYQAIKEDKQKRRWLQWEKVPILRPQDRSRYAEYKNRKRKDLDRTKSYVVWPPPVERAFEIGEYLYLAYRNRSDEPQLVSVFRLYWVRRKFTCAMRRGK